MLGEGAESEYWFNCSFECSGNLSILSSCDIMPLNKCFDSCMIANKQKIKLRFVGIKISLRIPDDLNRSLTVGKHNLKPACFSVYFATGVVSKTKHPKTMNETRSTQPIENDALTTRK